MKWSQRQLSSMPRLIWPVHFFLLCLAAECNHSLLSHGEVSNTPEPAAPWQHSLAICHGLIQTLLEQGEGPDHLKYIDDIVWSSAAEKVSEKRKRIIQILLKADLAINQIRVKGPAQEIQFWGMKWQDGCHHMPMDVINKRTSVFPSANKKETQALLSFVGFWRMHIPHYSQLALCLATQKKN